MTIDTAMVLVDMFGFYARERRSMSGWITLVHVELSYFGRDIAWICNFSAPPRRP